MELEEETSHHPNDEMQVQRNFLYRHHYFREERWNFICSRYLTSGLLLMKASPDLGIVYPLKILLLPHNFQVCNLVPRATNTTLTFAPVTGGGLPEGWNICQ